MEGIKISTNFYPGNNDIVIVELGGYVDQTNCNQVEKVISDIVKSKKLKIVFDFTDLIYMSSAGWGIFVGEIKMLRDLGGDIKISCMSPEVYDVFQMLEFFHIIQDFATLEEAVANFDDVEKEVNVSAKQDTVYNGENKSIEELLESSGVKSEITINDQDDEIVIDDNEIIQKPSIKEIPVEESKIPDKQVVLPKQEFRPVDLDSKIDIARLPLAEKIKRVVANYPLLSIFQIRKMLQHTKFGNTKVGLIKLYKLLRFLNLENRIKRYRFYRAS